MALTVQRVSVGTSATMIADAADADGVNVLLRNKGTASIFVGPSGVTTATGLEVAADESMSAELGNEESLYGICASGTQTVHVLRNRD
jgi:hypothetical protein